MPTPDVSIKRLAWGDVHVIYFCRHVGQSVPTDGGPSLGLGKFYILFVKEEEGGKKKTRTNTVEFTLS